MACSNGCVNGGGQPITTDRAAVPNRAKGLYDNDKMLQFHVSSENPYLQQIYAESLDNEKAHHLLHTEFENRRRITQEDFVLGESSGEKTISLDICFGTSCFLRGAQALYKDIMNYIRENRWEDAVEFKATFCGKRCQKGPALNVNGKMLDHCTFEDAKAEIQRALQK
jgi:NADH-quinone oxidoreductase subunit G